MGGVWSLWTLLGEVRVDEAGGREQGTEKFPRGSEQHFLPRIEASGAGLHLYQRNGNAARLIPWDLSPGKMGSDVRLPALLGLRQFGD